MTVSDPDAVQVLAAAMHQAECLLGARTEHRYSAGHHGVHVRRARHVLTALNGVGYHLSPAS